MADTSWLNKLTPEQDAVASKIIDKAIAMGIDPQLALALSYRESSFNQNARGKDGEIGVMQIMPTTGKGMGYSEKDLADLDKNIEAGLTYLKQNLDQFKNPMDAAAAYNAGPNHSFWKDPDKRNLPESTLSYLNDIEKLGGFGAAQPEEPRQPRPSADVDKPSSGDILDFMLGRSETISDEDKERLFANAIGAGVGGAGALAMDITGRGGRAFANRFLKPMQAAAQVAQSAQMPQVPQPPQMPQAPQGAGVRTPVAGGPAGPVGGPAGPVVRQGGTGTFNYGKAFGLTDIEAGRALDMTKQPGGAQDLMTQRREALNRIQQMGGGFAENPRYGGLMTPTPGAGGGPRASFTQTPTGLTQLPPTQPIPTTPPRPSPLAQMGQAAKQRAGALLRSPIGSAAFGVAGGLGAVSQGQEVQSRLEAGDIPGATIAGMGALGGGLQIIPYKPTQVLGTGLSIASPILMSIYDKLRQESPLEATQEEIRQAARPAFVFPRP